jgi:bacillopeptidase F
MKKHKRNQWWKVLLSLMLILPLLIPNMSFAQSNSDGKLSAKESSVTAPKNKVNKRLAKQFDKKENVTFLIKFKEQVDTAEVAKKAVKKAEKQKLSAAKSKYTKRSEVVSSLRATALETQVNVKDFLKAAKKAGKVKDYQSFYIVNAMAVTGTKEAMEKLASFPEVEKLLPNETRQLHKPTTKENPNTKLANTKADTQNIEWNIDKIGAPAVWEMGVDGSGTVVASIDTGVQWDHPALKEKYRGYDPMNPDQPNHELNWFDATADQPVPYDDHGHGTHVTGTMVGSEPDGSNQIGVAPGAKWIGVKAFTPEGGSDVDLLAAGEWILAPKDTEGNPHPEMAPDVVNNSWGGGPGLDEWYRPMVQNWRAAEIFPEFSAGNTDSFNPGGPESIATPANYPESFATGATDINNQLGTFSLQGPSPYDEVKPDISAPGVNIRSSVPGSTYEGGWNGTSMAGPHVAAVVALLKQADASLTVDEIEDILISTAVPATDATFPKSPNNGYGYGIVNAYDAVTAVTNGLGKVKGQVVKEGEDTEAPSFEHSGPSQTFTQMDIPLTISVQDNVSITSVTLEYKKQDGTSESVVAKRVSGNYKGGSFSATIPGADVAEGTLTYKWRIVDFGGNDAESESYSVTVLPGISVGYSQDFESEPTGWTSSGKNNHWERGIPTSGPETAVSGEKVYATNLAGNYNNLGNMTLLMPAIDLGDGPAYLQFKQWYDLEYRYDLGHVFVSTDLKNWEQKLRINGTTTGWTDGEIDLSEYAGQRIYVAFNLTTDFGVSKDGWYLDDVRLTDTALAPSSKAQVDKVKEPKVDTSMEKKDAVNPNEIQPNLNLPMSEQKSEELGLSVLPMSAVVSVLESGRSAYTDPATGSYEMNHAAGTYKMKAEAYGYYSQTQEVTIADEGVTNANFVLEEIPLGTVSGTITDEQTGDPIEGATLLLMEDAKVQPVETDADGQYSIEAFEGTYTLKVFASSYFSENVEITINPETAEVNVQLKPIVSTSGEMISYDDGTAENARSFRVAGNSWAVKMSLKSDQEKALVTGGLFRFWDTTWPKPGGTDFQVAVYDASGPEGAPGEKVGGPFDAKALRTGEWTHIDLREHEIMVEGDFYLVYIQTHPDLQAPGLAVDEDGEKANRSWQYEAGAWSPSPTAEGNIMIRAVVDYETSAPVITAPVITSPNDGTITNQSSVVVEGHSDPNVTVHLFNNDEEVASVATGEDGTFSSEVTLNEGENRLTVKASTDNGSSEASTPVKVVYDKVKPQLTIDSPENKLKTNQQEITVEGSVSDENLDWVKVNGQKITITDGKYSKGILLDEGENVIEVVARDKAGNQETKQVTVFAEFTAPVVENLVPTKNKKLKAGKSVKIAFDSEPGLDAVFTISQLTNATELPLKETSPGHYVGYYKATSKDTAKDAEIEVKITDDYGNETRQVAKGKITIKNKKRN